MFQNYGDKSSYTTNVLDHRHPVLQVPSSTSYYSMGVPDSFEIKRSHSSTAEDPAEEVNCVTSKELETPLQQFGELDGTQRTCWHLENWMQVVQNTCSINIDNLFSYVCVSISFFVSWRTYFDSILHALLKLCAMITSSFLILLNIGNAQILVITLLLEYLRHKSCFIFPL